MREARLRRAVYRVGRAVESAQKMKDRHLHDLVGDALAERESKIFLLREVGREDLAEYAEALDHVPTKEELDDLFRKEAEPDESPMPDRVNGTPWWKFWSYFGR